MNLESVKHLVRRSSESGVVVKLLATPSAFDIRMKIDHLPRIQDHPAVRLLTDNVNYNKNQVNATTFDLSMVSILM